MCLCTEGKDEVVGGKLKRGAKEGTTYKARIFRGCAQGWGIEELALARKKVTICSEIG